MLKLQNRFVAGVRADTNVEYAIQGSRRVRWDDLHITQSELDGACGLVCILQCAMILGGLRRNDVEDISNSKSGPLHVLWKLASSAYFKGSNEQQIEGFIGAFKPRLRSKTVEGSNVKELAQEIADAIDAGHVPILGIENRSIKHWTLVIGYERESGKNKPLALLCLDASNSRPPWSVFYNARCSLQPTEFGKNRKPKRYPLRYASVDGGLCNVRLNGLVIVKRGLAVVC